MAGVAGSAVECWARNCENLSGAQCEFKIGKREDIIPAQNYYIKTFRLTWFLHCVILKNQRLKFILHAAAPFTQGMELKERDST